MAIEVSVQDLGFSAAGRELFQGLSHRFTPGLHLVRGGEGRGKTLLLRLLAGELTPTAGRVLSNGAVRLRPDPLDPAHDPTVARDWLDGLAAAQPRWRAGAVAGLAAALGLDEHLPKPMYMLSAGSRRKVGLLAAAVSGADLVLLDQPYAALDARSCRVLDECFAEVAEGAGPAWVVADHERPRPWAAWPLAGEIDLGD